MVTLLWKKNTTAFSQNNNKLLSEILVAYVLPHIVPDIHNTTTQTNIAKQCKDNQGFLYIF